MPKRPVQIDDMLRYRLLEEHVLNPDGVQIAMTVSSASGEGRKYQSAIWLTDVNGREPRRLTGGEVDNKPRWSPDGGKLAFLSDRGDGPQIRVLDLSGGESTAVSAVPGGVGDYEWSPDGSSFVIVAANVAPAGTPEVRRITRVHYKNDGLGLLSEDRAHLWLLPAGGGGLRQLTDGDEDDLNPAWSPDGGSISFNRTRPSAGGSAPFMDVCVVDIASGAVRNLTNGAGPCFGARWSPDGRTLAYIGHTEPNDIWWGKNFEVWTVPAAGGERRLVNEGFTDICARAVFGDPWRGIPLPKAMWSTAGDRLFFIATVGGSVHLFSAASSGGDVQPLTSGRSAVTDFDVVSDTVVFGRMSSSEPTELFRTSTTGGEPAQITSLNAALLDEMQPGEAELISFASFDGTTIEAWLQPPAGFDPNGNSTHPLVVSIHGGPHAAYGEAYHHSFQSLAGAGAFVLYVNPRGSQGYGEEFAKLCIADWGGGDYQDIMAAVDYVIARGRVDPSRLAAWGASYGGFMTTWMAGQTDRFAAICSVIPVTDLISFYGTSDIGHYFTPFEMGAQPWEDRERYVRMSPLTYADRVTTPLLLVHHEQDLRCPIAQSEQYFVTLKSLGKTVEFVRIDQASHGIVPPARAHAELDGLELAHDWFRRYIGIE